VNVFELIIFPFYYIVEQLFLFGYRLTGNYGVAIILLSFGISLLLLPVFMLIEKGKKRNDTIKRKMKPVLDEIKRCYRGQERYYYIRTLHRQHGYNSFRALIPVLTLLLQIPFFIAAYQFLENYEPLTGQGFLMIGDLSEPDSLLGRINLLPILMTLVNLVTAYFYTKNGNGAERRQMLVIAGIFLVLLYNFPSGLVLYWTMNNVFSFFRLFITHPEVFRKKASGKDSKGIMRSAEEFLARLRTGIVRLEVHSRVYFSLLFLALYFLVSGKYYFEEDNSTLLWFSIAAVLLLQAVGILYFFRRGVSGKLRWYRLNSSLLMALFLLQSTIAYLFLRNGDASIQLFNISIANENIQVDDMIYPGLLFIVISLPAYFRLRKIRVPGTTAVPNAIFMLSAAYVAGFVTIWNPLQIYSSFPETFNFSALDLLIKNMPYLALLLLVAVTIFYFTPRRYRWILSAVALTAVAISFIHNAILPIDMGTLQENKFEKEQALIVSPAFYLIEAIGIVILFGAAFYLLLGRKYVKQIIFGLAILNMVVLFQGLYSAATSGSFLESQAQMKQSSYQIEFSRTEKNVIYLIPDMFQGWAMHRMMNENPELKAQLEGFTWYPNALAVSRVTNTSVGPLLGGHSYAPDSLDLDTEKTVEEKLSGALRDLSNTVRQQGYMFTTTHLPYTNVENEYIDTYLPSWHEDWDRYNSQLGIEVTKESNHILLMSTALFFSAPLAFKSKIYDNGQWLFLKGNKEGRITSTSLKHQFLRVLPYISRVGPDKGSFVVIYSMVSHFPWSMTDEKGRMVTDVSPYENNKWIIEQLSAWIRWMKQNDVYDNTRIVLVSDHGTHWRRFNRELDIDNPFYNINDESVPLKYMLDLNPLILVKDFNARGPFSENRKFMSNMDAIDIALGNLDPSATSIPDSRELPAFVSWWTQDMNNRTKFSLEHKYVVKESIFDADNWTMVWDKNLGRIDTTQQSD